MALRRIIFCDDLCGRIHQRALRAMEETRVEQMEAAAQARFRVMRA